MMMKVMRVEWEEEKKKEERKRREGEHSPDHRETRVLKKTALRCDVWWRDWEEEG